MLLIDYQGPTVSGKYSSLKYLPLDPSGPISVYLAMRFPASSSALVPWLDDSYNKVKQSFLLHSGNVEGVDLLTYILFVFFVIRYTSH